MKVIKLIVATIMTVVVIVTCMPGNAYAMCGKNNVIKFCTNQGSYYDVQEKMVTRRKFDGTIHTNPKNIYYGTEAQVKEASKAVKDAGAAVNIEQMLLGKGLTKAAELKKRPFDLLLKSDCTKESKTRKHYGHEINYIGPNASVEFCRV